jgi:hypothetical protein
VLFDVLACQLLGSLCYLTTAPATPWWLWHVPLLTYTLAVSLLLVLLLLLL